APVGHAGREDVAGDNAEVALQLASQHDQKPDVIDMTAVRRRSSSPVGPALVVAVGIDHQQVLDVGNGIEVSETLLPDSGAPDTVQVKPHNEGRPPRHMHPIRPSKPPKLKSPRLVSSASRYPLPTPGQADHRNAQEGGQR